MNLEINTPDVTKISPAAIGNGISYNIPFDHVSVAKLSRLNRNDFPDQPSSPGRNLPLTLENFQHVIRESGIVIRFNNIKKRPEIMMPGVETGTQNRDEVTLSHLESLFIRNEMGTGQLRNYVLATANSNSYDPFADWVDSKPWDGVSRIAELCATIEVEEGYPQAFRDILISKWLLSIVAATFKEKGFHSRGVLTLQGAQGLGKTSWIANLVTPLALRDDVVKLGHSWDGGSKDARLLATTHRIVELGELEGSFKKDMASLKAFTTEANDKIRPPYGRVAAEYPRSTVFAASVNDPQFLIDTTGNSRFWTIAAKTINFNHGIDMQQLFAELKVAYEAGDQWWLTTEEEETLSGINNQHRVHSSIEAKIVEAIEPSGTSKVQKLTANEVLKRLGYEKPSNAQSKEANVALKALLGDPKRVRGANRWDIVWRGEDATAAAYFEQEDEY